MASNKARKDLTKQVESSVSHLSKKAGKLTESVTKTAASTIATLKKDVGHQLDHFTAKAQEVVVEVPKDLNKKASGFPWAIVITIGMAIGFVVGLLFLPVRQPVKPAQI
jgi:ElaB/YqjD/DUF883 family membrane-anchored ribosome-binding protein